MVATVDLIANQKGFEKSSIRTGFHWPPFNTVNHLHLHVISPIEDMGTLHRIMFKPDSYWFVSVRRSFKNQNTFLLSLKINVKTI